MDATLNKPQSVIRNPKSALITLIRFRLLALRNQLHALRHESQLKIFVLTVLGTLFWIGVFALFMHGFQFVQDNAGFAHTFLIHYILSLFFLALTFMLAFSNAVISFSNLFRSPETAFLFALPMRQDTIYMYKLFESLLFSSWAVFALGVPLLLAYGVKSGASWYFYPLIPVFLVPFVILPCAIGGLAGMLLTAVVPRHRTHILGVLALVVAVVGIYVSVTVLSVEGRFNNSGMEASVKAIMGKLSFTQHYLTPNYWITEGLLSVSEARAGSARAALIFFSALSSSALFFAVLGWFLAGTLYESTYSLASGTVDASRVARRSRLETLLEGWLNRHPEIGVLLLKDVKTFLRDPAQWSQVLIFFGILVLYIGNLRNFSYPLEQPFYQNLIAFLNLGATCMTLATVTSRFVFPLISLEGRRFWVLGLVPLQRRHIMWSKFYFSFCGSVLICSSLVLLSNYILGSPLPVLMVQLATGVLLSLGLSGLSVGMGALFPNFHERNPSKIVSGFGGTLNLILAIALVVLTIGAEGLLCHRFIVVHMADDVSGGASSWNWFYAALMAAMVGLNILACYLPMRLGIQALERVEF